MLTLRNAIISVPLIVLLYVKTTRAEIDSSLIFSLVFLMGNIPLFVSIWKINNHSPIELGNSSNLPFFLSYNFFSIICLYFISTTLPVFIIYGLNTYFLLKILENFCLRNNPNDIGIVYGLLIVILNLQIVFLNSPFLSDPFFNYFFSNLYISKISYGIYPLNINIIFPIILYITFYSISRMTFKDHRIRFK